jgi:phosphatidate cytidylyltransferase
MMKRVITAIFLGVGIVAALWLLPELLIDLLVLLIVLFGLFEFGRMFLDKGVMRLALMIGGGLLAAVMLFMQNIAILLPLIIVGFVFVVALLIMSRSDSLEGTADKLGLAVLGFLYLGLAMPFWGWIRAMEGGAALVLLALVPACLCDTFAYVAGKSFGKRKFAPVVSPNKTMAGFVGALIGSLVGAFIIWAMLLRAIPAYHIVILSLIIWISSPFGDLIESMLKRSCGVKDSGGAIPGHGGALDRLDALIFTGPAAFAYYAFVIFA